MSSDRHRELEVPERAAGMRLDRFLSLRFADRSRSWFARGIRDGLVRDAQDRPLRASTTLRGGERLRVYLPGIAPSEPPPPLPPILFEDERIVVVDKPAGMLAHPTGTAFAWAVVSLAKARWGGGIDLVHRLDRDTSGVLLLTKDVDANRALKAALHDGEAIKEYEALCRGLVPWEDAVLDGPIGAADGPIRIQMAVRDDGLPARTDVRVLARRDGPVPLTRVHCRLHTGRTHQIRVHLADARHPVLGDRLYGLPPEVFLDAWENGVTDATLVAAGAPRHALHAARVTLPHPDGGTLTVEAPFPDDLARWWARPDVLPLDREDSTAADSAR